MARDIVRLIHSLLPAAATLAEHAAWQPPADIYRTRDGWLVKVDLAGVKPEDVKLSAGGSQLRIRGLRSDWCVADECRCYHMEIAYSTFDRVLTMPCDLDQAQISAEHKEGMLLVRIQTGSAN
jgi:HSP20 family protein